jgi:hypothetical protein
MISGVLLKAAGSFLLGLLKSPMAWLFLLLLAMTSGFYARGCTIDTLRTDLKSTRADLETRTTERDDARREHSAALAANVKYALAERRRDEEARAFAAEQARIQAELRGLLAVTRRQRDDADRTFKAFVAQFDAAPESCHIATRQMEAACAALSDY